MRVGWEGCNNSQPTDTQAVNFSNSDNQTNGSFWILDCDTNWMGVFEPHNTVPVDAGRLVLAPNMEERCKILKDMGAKHYPNLAAYDAESEFLRSFEWKREGEVDALELNDHPS